MITIGIQAENLRNKYKNHSIIKPLILYCRKNKLSFEFLKEIVQGYYGIKSFNTTNVYYMKIGNNLLKQESNFYRWENLLDLITYAYEYLNVKKPKNLIRAVNSFKEKV